MKKNILYGALFLIILLFGTHAKALEGLYLGAEVGNVGLTGDMKTFFNNALGFGVDLGLKTSSPIDVTLSFQTSSHSGITDLSLYAPFVSADIHVGQTSDLDFIVSVGPGFYTFKAGGVSSTKFGIQGGGAVDVLVDEKLKVGLGFRFHGVFGSDAGSTGSYWTAMARLGYIFGFN
jgi:hypothetical protein